MDPVSQFMNLDDWPPSEEEDPSSSAPATQSSDTYLVGFVIVNIVGLQYYSGRISGREMVGLVREPLNPYDSNAIKVVNTRTVQVGHIERRAASVLAPLMDSNLIVVEGIVPNSPKGSSVYKLPCQVHVFAKIEAIDSVKSAISGDGLCLITQDDDRFGLSAAAVVKEKKGDVDEIFKLVDENLSKNKAVMEVKEAPKGVILPELFLHQKEGLSWLFNKENSCELPPFWEERGGVFVNVLTNHEAKERPEPLRGGIFADDMGLGKTLTLLSLIATDKYDVVNDQTTEAVIDDDALVIPTSKRLKRGRVSKNCSISRNSKKMKCDDPVSDKSVKEKPVGRSSLRMTLIVCPPSVFSTWITQITEHTKPGKLKAYLYYGQRTQDVSELQQYDIVLTTYSTLGNELRDSKAPIKKINWWRVILDEAHVIKNPSACQSEAVIGLNAERRWVVTGTPIQNGSMDLFSLMAFLKFHPFSIRSYWNSLVQRPLAQGRKNGLSRLQALMATISLRRTKEKALIGLPQKTIETWSVELSVEERQLYDEMEMKAKNFVQSYISDRVTYGYTTVLSMILRLRQICTNTALCPSDLITSFPTNSFEDVSNNPELLKKLLFVLQDGEDITCPICLSTPTDMIITRCAHIFCRHCIIKTLKLSKSCCPLCRRHLSETDLYSAPPESADDADKVDLSSCKKSSKVSALLKLLLASREQNPSVKSVIFSQFRKLLLLLEEPLKAAGFKTLRLDGVMSAKRRAQVIKEFGATEPDGPTILLASLKASGTGINLTAASRVYLMEPWWNPAVEEQAMDRVHRIGQKEEVKIVRLIAQNSIDERILELQDKKKHLATEAFRKRGKEINVDDLRTLMSL